MADVYGRLTGRAAVAMATLGPGATNLVTGIADAFLDRAPMVAITGQASSSDKLHKEAHQVVDIVRMFEPVTKWNTRVERIEAIPEIVRKAFRVATLEKPGPTHIELPENLAAMAVPPDGDGGRAAHPRPDLLPRADRRGDRPRGRPDRGLGAAARSWPATASCGGAHRRTCARSRAACTSRSPPRSWARARSTTGRTSRSWRSGSRPATTSCPASTGPTSSSASATTSSSTPRRRWNPDGRKRIIHIDTQPAEVDAAYRPEVELIGDIDGTLRRLLAAVLPRGIGGRDAERAARVASEILVHADLRTQLLAELGAHEANDAWPITPQRAIADLRRALGPERHRRVATSAPTRSGSPGCTRPTSRTP